MNRKRKTLNTICHSLYYAIYTLLLLGIPLMVWDIIFMPLLLGLIPCLILAVDSLEGDRRVLELKHLRYTRSTKEFRRTYEQIIHP